MTRIFKIENAHELKFAGSRDIIKLLPVGNKNALFIPKYVLRILTFSIVNAEFIHISGPTGTAKSSLIEALCFEPRNFEILCRQFGYEPKPIKLFPIEMAIFELPGELYQRRALKNGTTYDEYSELVNSLISAYNSVDNYYPLIWLREIGRVHTPSVQGGLLDLMTKGDIILPGNKIIKGEKIAWIADSNYQAEEDANHVLVNFDDALKRRFTVNLTLDYLNAEQEQEILKQICNDENLHNIDYEIIIKIVKLGKKIREKKMEGSLSTLTPPTIYGYMAFLRLYDKLEDLSIQEMVFSTFLGNCSYEDRKLATSLFNEVFGFEPVEEENPNVGAQYF